MTRILLPPFDMQVGQGGVLLGWFDHVSCIRTVVESTSGEDWVRYVDCHYFEQAKTIRTNPKTILHAPEVLDDADAMNLWTRVQDLEATKAHRDFGIEKDEPPRITFSLNVWKEIDFSKTYEETIDVAAEFGADQVFIDSVWQNGETLRQQLENHIGADGSKGTILEKFFPGNMCCTLDFEVSETAGGEEALKALCDRAAAKGVKIMSWMSTHYWPHTMLARDAASARELGHGSFGVFAAKESGRHLDTGYADACWTLNLNAPVYEKVREQILGVCERTGLSGFLWDSFSNLGWWQVDYSDGSMRPQFDRMAKLFADLANAGLYIQLEAIVSFTSHSACGLFGGNVYEGDLLGYSYDTVIDLRYPDEPDGPEIDHGKRILTGEEPIDIMFRCFAHRRIVSVPANSVPREDWDTEAIDKIKELFRVYRENRHLMGRRTVLKDDAGVLWENDGKEWLLFSFMEQAWGGQATDAGTGNVVETLHPNRTYRITAD